MEDQHQPAKTDGDSIHWFPDFGEKDPRAYASVETIQRFHKAGQDADGTPTAQPTERYRAPLTEQIDRPQSERSTESPHPADPGAILFGELAEMWFSDYVDNPKIRLAEPTRSKYRTRLRHHILPRWKDVPVSQVRSKAILDWLHAECSSWYMMVDLRNIMSTIIAKAQEWEVLPDTFANPTRRVKLGRRWVVRPEQILSQQETMEVLSRLSDPHLLICETCLSTGARVSEVLGLTLKHLDLARGVLWIQQRHCRGDIDVPKTKNSRRVLTLGRLAARYRNWIKEKNITQPQQWLFARGDDPQQPMWDSGIRKALKIAAAAAGHDFPGFGLHSFRRANITWRQEVGASAIEASKIAGHSSVNMTNDYTHVQLRRQEDLTRAIQARLNRVVRPKESKSHTR